MANTSMQESRATVKARRARFASADALIDDLEGTRRRGQPGGKS